jgi:hypothetical protein
MTKKLYFLTAIVALSIPAASAQRTAPVTSVLRIQGTRFLLDDRPLYFQGLSFFNALYNKEFNQSAESRERWLRTFKSYGITVLRVWGDWRVTNGWIDEGPNCSLYVYPEMEGRDRRFEPRKPRLHAEAVQRLKDLLIAANQQGMVVELALFSHYLVYPVETRNEFIRLITDELRPYRNVIFEIWNEYNEKVVEHCQLIKWLDPQRLVSNSPGGSSAKATHAENVALDILCPHTTRRPAKGNFWEIAPLEIKQLVEAYQKPVIDDEPARCGIRDFGGNEETNIEWHIAQNEAVRKYGGHHIYHHDMFQLPYGNAPTPPSGIPEPQFSKFHLKMFEYLRSIAPPEVTRGREVPAREKD